MKVLGLLGGMSYESTETYYRLINEGVQKKLGGSHSAELYIYSFDYKELEVLLEKNDWLTITSLLSEQGQRLKKAGAEGIMLLANTMHIVADQVEKGVGLPLIHIVKSTMEKVIQKGLTRVLLIGTRYTMESPLYPETFESQGIEVKTPNTEEQAIIHNIIYQELIRGTFSDQSRKEILKIIQSYQNQGIEGVILGCTELPLLIRLNDVSIHRFDTMEIHAQRAVDWILS